jgi:hypothetical protein
VGKLVLLGQLVLLETLEQTVVREQVGKLVLLGQLVLLETLEQTVVREQVGKLVLLGQLVLKEYKVSKETLDRLDQLD